MKISIVFAALLGCSSAVSLSEPTLLMNESEGNSERFQIASRRHHDDNKETETNKHKTTLTIVQDFPKKLTEAPINNVEMVDIQTYDVEVIDHKDNQKTVLTIVQDFAKKHKHDNYGSIEMVQGQSRDIDFEDDNHKKTTLTIVQDFPKKIAEQSGHSIELVQEMGMTPSINSYVLESLGY